MCSFGDICCFYLQGKRRFIPWDRNQDVESHYIPRLSIKKQISRPKYKGIQVGLVILQSALIVPPYTNSNRNSIVSGSRLADRHLLLLIRWFSKSEYCDSSVDTACGPVFINGSATFSRLSVQTEVHPSYPKDTRDSFPGNDNSPPWSVQVKEGGATPALPHVLTA